MSQSTPVSARKPARMTTIVLALGGAKLAAHLATAGHYPFHRDELYYIACGRHLAWSYPDHPPLVPWLVGLTERLAGVDPFRLRLWPALAGAALVVLAGWLAWRLGGGRLAQVLAALAVVSSPLFLLANSLMQTVSVDQFLWTASAAVVAAILYGARAGMWLPVGLLIGLGMLAKLTILAWVLGVLAGLLLTEARAWLTCSRFWLGVAAAAVCALPVLVWQATHGWPVLEFMAASRADNPVTPWGFLAMQAGMSGPIMGPLLLVGGFVFLLGPSEDKARRTLGWAVAVAWGVFLATGGKPYYAGPTYPLLFAGGAVLAERLLARRTHVLWRAVPVALLVSQVWMVPAFLPVLPPAQLAGRLDRLPHDDWHNTFGWEDLASQAASVCHSLPPADREGLRVLTDDYGTAGAIDFYGPALGLPPAVSGHNGYAFWETSPALDPLIVIGYGPDGFRRNYDLVREYGGVERAEPIGNEETGEPLFYCKGLQTSAEELWAALRHFD